MDNRRAFIRYELYIAGKLIWRNGASACDCTIRDLSEGGACVDTGNSTEVPTEVTLFEGRDGNLFECEVRWQNDTMIGIRFVDVCGRAKRRALIERYALHTAAVPAQ